MGGISRNSRLATSHPGRGIPPVLVRAAFIALLGVGYARGPLFPRDHVTHVENSLKSGPHSRAIRKMRAAKRSGTDRPSRAPDRNKIAFTPLSLRVPILDNPLATALGRNGPGKGGSGRGLSMLFPCVQRRCARLVLCYLPTPPTQPLPFFFNANCPAQVGQVL